MTKKTKPSDLDALHRLALAVIWRAADDMRRKGTHIPKEWVEATVFLASESAFRWYDAAQLEPISTLSRLRWVFYAQKLLDDPEIKMSKKQRKMLQQGVTLFNT